MLTKSITRSIPLISKQFKNSSNSFKRYKSVGIDLISPLIGLNTDQCEFYNLARQFANTEMRPNAGIWEEEETLPVDVMKKLGELGFGGIVVSNDLGGSELSRVDSTIIVEALATGCVGTTAMLTIHNMCAWMIGNQNYDHPYCSYIHYILYTHVAIIALLYIDTYGSPEQRALFLPSMCALDTLASYCLTEPGQ